MQIVPQTSDVPPAEKPKEKKSFFTWEHNLEIAKIMATVWVALIGTFVTMQFNERQHELNSMEAIAKILPHLDDNTKAGTSSMSRDGAIWAAFRIANNKTMLRDLAALFPDDIYRVVSSIATSDGLDHDEDALRALEVSSEKLASRYAEDSSKQALSARLLQQAVNIREHLNGRQANLNIVDLSSASSEDWGESADQVASLMMSLNVLGDMHMQTAEKRTGVTTDRSRARQLYSRARRIGLSAKQKDDAVITQLIRTDRSLSALLRSEGKSTEAQSFELEAQQLDAAQAKHTDLAKEAELLDKKFATLDQDGDGSISKDELESGLKRGVLTTEEYDELHKHFDEIANAHQDSPRKVGGLFSAGAPVFEESKPQITRADLQAAAPGSHT